MAGKCALMLNIPSEIHSQFKMACWSKNTSMTKVLLSYMQNYVQLYEAEQATKYAMKAEDFGMITAGD